MNQQLAKLKNLRRFLWKQLDGLSAEQLNQVPAAYHNNLIWNLGHLLAAEQSLCYLRAGQPLTVEERFVQPYLPGTRPAIPVGEQDIATIKELLIRSPDRLQADFDRGVFCQYSPSPMVAKLYGVAVNSIEDAFDFLLYHEGFHTGYCLALKRLLQ